MRIGRNVAHLADLAPQRVRRPGLQRGGQLLLEACLREAGMVVRRDKSLAAIHRRRFTLRSLLLNDFRRAFGWAALGLSKRGLAGSARQGLANVSADFVASLALAGGLLAFAALALWRPALAPLPVATAAAYVAAGRLPAGERAAFSSRIALPPVEFAVGPRPLTRSPSAPLPSAG